MLGPRYRHRSLGELSDEELVAMLKDDETLFTEHKSDLKNEAYNVSRAVASFANTLGGWVLIGVSNGDPVDGWKPPEGVAFVDAVGERLAHSVDPVPSFAAAVRTVRGGPEHWEGREVGVIRVYESVDTPHIMKRAGVVFVREVARDRKVRPAKIGSHVELTRLAEKGERARAAAMSRLDEGNLPLIEEAMGLTYTDTATKERVFRTPYSRAPKIVIRLAPLTVTSRFTEWATSSQALVGAKQAAAHVTESTATDEEPAPHPQGLYVARQEFDWRPLSARESKYRRRATVAIDAAGMVALATEFEVKRADGVHQHYEFRRERIADTFILPPLRALAAMLERHELYGRYVSHMLALRLGEVVRTADDKGTAACVPLGGELTVPALDSERVGPELNALVERWTYALARAYGLPEFAAATR